MDEWLRMVEENEEKIMELDTKEDSADSLEKAIERVKAAYNAQEIILDAEDLVPDYTTGESVSFCEADWIDPDEIQKKDVDFTL